MTRASMYAIRKAGAIAHNVGTPDLDPDRLHFFEARYFVDGVEVWHPIMIWHGDALGPDGEWWTRIHGWHSLVNGEYELIEAVWPECSGRPIDEEQYAAMMEVNRHG